MDETTNQKRVKVRVRHEDRMYQAHPFDRWVVQVRRKTKELIFHGRLSPLKYLQGKPKFMIEQPHRYRGFWGEILFPVTEAMTRVMGTLFPSSKVARRRRKKVRRITNAGEFFVDLIFIVFSAGLVLGIAYIIYYELFLKI